MKYPQFLRPLDWKTRPRDAVFRAHSRVLLCSVVGTVLGVLAWHTFYPHLFWFFLLWIGTFTGAAIGGLCGIVWQLSERSRQPTTSGQLMLVLIGIALIAALVAPGMLTLFEQHEAARLQVRAIANHPLVGVQIDGRTLHFETTDTTSIADLKRRLATAELFYPSHEGSTHEFELRLLHAGGEYAFPARIPERHPDDIAIKIDSAELLVQGGAAWMRALTASNGS